MAKVKSKPPKPVPREETVSVPLALFDRVRDKMSHPEDYTMFDGYRSDLPCYLSPETPKVSVPLWVMKKIADRLQHPEDHDMWDSYK